MTVVEETAPAPVSALVDRGSDETTREYVKRTILRANFACGDREFSAKDLRNWTGLPINLCSYYVKKLCDEGWLLHTRTSDNRVGSPRKLYVLY